MTTNIVQRTDTDAGFPRKQARKRFTIEVRFTFGVAAEFRPEWHVYSRYECVHQRDHVLRRYERKYGNIMDLRKGYS